jgi:hypothetical protein
VTTDFGLGQFGTTIEQARQAYRAFMAQPMYASENRLLDDTHPEDSRIIGADRFVAALRISPYRPKTSMSLEQLADIICARHGVSVAALTSPRRLSTLMQARRELTRRAIDERVANLRQVADFLRREPSSVGRLLQQPR